MIHQNDEPFFRLQIEHVIARQHGGSHVPDNLALACLHCNAHKGANLTGIDPETGDITPLFNPRTETWAEHFSVEGEWIVGLSATGRATIRVLAMNDRRRRELRQTIDLA
ncbi:MAG: HNH endonuclease [Pirellulales bacterium]|nr:HNH endonuclease [Pirellulales bacterium]